MSNSKYWDAMRTPPAGALKKISFGNLKGKSDINPQWRMQTMTEQFGPCGIGWTYEVNERWTEAGPHETVAAFVSVSLKVCVDGKWSEGIPGAGGSMLIVKDKNGLHINDEAYKMATTDALSVAMKQLGVAADIYMGIMDGSKYQTPRTAVPYDSKLEDDARDLFDTKKETLTPVQANWCMDTMKKDPALVIEKLKGM